MTERIDTRGLSCPQPVIQAKKALEKGGIEKLEVLADTVTSRENISRMARNSGYEVAFEEKDGDFLLKLSKK